VMWVRCEKRRGASLGIKVAAVKVLPGPSIAQLTDELLPELTASNHTGAQSTLLDSEPHAVVTPTERAAAPFARPSILTQAEIVGWPVTDSISETPPQPILL